MKQRRKDDVSIFPVSSMSAAKGCGHTGVEMNRFLRLLEALSFFLIMLLGAVSWTYYHGRGRNRMLDAAVISLMAVISLVELCFAIHRKIRSGREKTRAAEVAAAHRASPESPERESRNQSTCFHEVRWWLKNRRVFG